MKIFKIPTCKEVYHQNHASCNGGKDKAKLNLKERLLMKLHLYMCKNCQRFEDGLKSMHEKMVERLKTKMNNLDTDKVNDLKEKIKSQIKKS